MEEVGVTIRLDPGILYRGAWVGRDKLAYTPGSVEGDHPSGIRVAADL